jgi:hypothetical protein
MTTADEEVVTESGDLCTIKDCCVVLCGESPTPNPGRGVFTNRAVLERAYDAVGTAVAKLNGPNAVARVRGVLDALPVAYNARLTRAIGRAKFAYEKGVPYATMIELTGTIEIPDDYMHRLLVHEGCHVARCVIAEGAFAYEPPHGRMWQWLMIGAGERPEATCIDPRIIAQGAQRRGLPEVQVARHEVQLGDRVSFAAGKRGRIVGVVLAKADRTVTVRDDAGSKWRASYALLTKEPTP